MHVGTTVKMYNSHADSVKLYFCVVYVWVLSMQIAHLLNLEDGLFPYLITQRMLLVSLHIPWGTGNKMKFCLLCKQHNSWVVRSSLVP